MIDRASAESGVSYATVLLGALIALTLSAPARSQNLDGPWRGTLECGPIPFGIPNAADAPPAFSNRIELDATGPVLSGHYENEIAVSSSPAASVAHECR